MSEMPSLGIKQFCVSAFFQWNAYISPKNFRRRFFDRSNRWNLWRTEKAESIQTRSLSFLFIGCWITAVCLRNIRKRFPKKQKWNINLVDDNFIVFLFWAIFSLKKRQFYVASNFVASVSEKSGIYPFVDFSNNLTTFDKDWQWFLAPQVL